MYHSLEKMIPIKIGRSNGSGGNRNLKKDDLLIIGKNLFKKSDDDVCKFIKCGKILSDNQHLSHAAPTRNIEYISENDNAVKYAYIGGYCEKDIGAYFIEIGNIESKIVDEQIDQH